MVNHLNTSITPFLKWAGGKRWLAEKHLNLFPEFSGRYIEPFLGGASVFFKLRPSYAVLSDANPRLIECYQEIRDNPERIQKLLVRHQQRHSTEHYYDVRAFRYRHSWQRAAQFLYLNRTCWNGLYRVNRRGEFNVPIGTKNSVLLSTDDFESVSALLQNVALTCSDFQPAIEAAEEGDLVYVDPPYTVQHNFNGFVKYNENIFSWADQIRLRDAVVAASNRGVRVVVSNAAHSSILQLYENVGQVHNVTRSSVLAADGARRGNVDELMVIL